MEYLNALLLNAFEMTFVFISLLMLLQQRKAIGLAPFYLAFGFLLFLALLSHCTARYEHYCNNQ